MRNFLLLLCVVTAAAQPPEKLLEAAHHAAVIEGNLRKAISQYRQIAEKFKAQPGIAAKALLQMGECQEKLGQAEAKSSYERIVNDYGTVASFASQAKTRLLALNGGTTSTPSSKLIWDGAVDFWGIVSTDGRFLSHVDWSTGDLAIRDLKLGESRRITNYGGYEKAQGEVESTSISPDGKRIIFNWDGWGPGSKENGYYQLRIINADGTGERVLRKPQKDLYFEANGWSPDGKWVALCESTSSPGNRSKAKIVLFSPDSGERREINTPSEMTKFSISFSPDSKWLAYSEAAVWGGKKRNVHIVSATAENQKDTLVAQDAVFMGWAPSGESIVIMRSALGGGHLYTLDIKDGLAVNEARRLHLPISDGATPLGLTPSGSLIYGSTNQKDETSLRKLSRDLGVSSVSLWEVPTAQIGFANNLGNPRFSPDSKWLATAGSTQSIRLRDVESANERILAVQGEMLRFEWMPDGSALIATVLSKDSANRLYLIDAATGKNTFLCNIDLGRVFTPATDGKSVFHLRSTGLASVDLATGKETLLFPKDLNNQGPMNVRRSPDGKLLLLSTFHWLAVYDIAARSTKDLFVGSFEQNPNIWGADWTADSQQVLANVRPYRTGSRDRQIWTFSLSGGEPKRQDLPGIIRDFATSPDGNYAAISFNHSHSQIWAVNHFLPAKK